MTTFKRPELALAAYNAGPGRVMKNWSVPRIAETMGYVSVITSNWRKMDNVPRYRNSAGLDRGQIAANTVNLAGYRRPVLISYNR